MAGYSLREIIDTDTEKVVALWEKSGLTRPWNDPYQDILFAGKSENATILVAEAAEAIVAAVMVGHDGHRGWVYYLAAAPEWRGTGLGKKMLEAAESWLYERGLWKVQLLVRKDNEAMVSFYEHLGYHDVATVCLQKTLDRDND